jgi:hypothetical protein
LSVPDHTRVFCDIRRKSQVQPVSAGASLVAEADPAVLIAQPRRQLTQNLEPVLKNAELVDLAASAILGNRHRRLVHIQSNVRDRVHPARLPCMRLSPSYDFFAKSAACVRHRTLIETPAPASFPLPLLDPLCIPDVVELSRPDRDPYRAAENAFG